MAVSATVVPVVIPVVVVHTEGLSVRTVGTIEIVDASTPIQTAAAVSNTLGIDPLLLQLNLVGIVVEVSWAALLGQKAKANIIAGVVSNVGPASDVDAVAIVAIEKFPWFAQAAISKKTATQ